MAKLLIQTQVYENYAWREDGTIGTGAEAYWKAKGGSDYVIRNIDINRVQELAKSACAQVEQASDYFTETVIGWEVMANDYLTDFERSQLEYEGRIRFPSKELELA
jgi:hypothetical protein